MNSRKDKVPVVRDGMYVILGASGNTGSIIANFLLLKGEKVRVERRKSSRNLASLMEDPMTHENNLVAVGQFDGNAYESSQAAELTLNGAILRAEIARSYEDFLQIFDKFYDDDVEVSSEDSPETIRGKERVRAFLSNFLVPLHVMAEVAGLSVSVQQTEVPRDSANETHSGWKIDFTGVGGSWCTLKWNAIRKWKASRVVYEHHYDHEQIGGPLTEDDLNLNWGCSEAGPQLPS